MARTDTNLVASLTKAEAFKLANEERKQQMMQQNLLKSLVTTNSNMSSQLSDFGSEVESKAAKRTREVKKMIDELKQSSQSLNRIGKSLNDSLKDVGKGKEKIDLTKPTTELVSSVQSIEDMFKRYTKTKDPHGVASEFKRTIGKVTAVMLSKKRDDKVTATQQPKDFLRTDDDAMLKELVAMRQELEELREKGMPGTDSDVKTTIMKTLGAAAIALVLAGKGVGLSGLLKHTKTLYKLFAPKSLQKVVSFITKPIGTAFKKMGAKIFGPLKSFGKTVGKKLIKGLKGVIPKFGDDILKVMGKIGGKVGAKAAGKGALKFGAKALKALPGIGTIVAIPFAINRFKRGDVVGGLIEIASGIASLDPTGAGGTAVSIALEAYQVFRDMKGDAYKKKEGAALKKIALRNIPIIGPITRIKSAMEMWKNDKVGAMVEFAGAAVSIVPASGFIFDLGVALVKKLTGWGSVEATQEKPQESSGLGQQVLRNLPVIGTAIQIKEGMDMWKDDKLGALKMIGRGAATMVPGGGFIFDAAAKLLEWVSGTKIGEGLSNVGAGLAEAAGAVWDSLKKGIGAVFDGAKGLAKKAWGGVKSLGGKAKDLFGAGVGAVKGFFGFGKKEEREVRALTEEEKQKLKEFGINVWNKAQDIMGGALETGKKLLSKISDDPLVKKTKEIAKNLFQPIGGFFDNIFGGAKALTEKYSKTGAKLAGKSPKASAARQSGFKADYSAVGGAAQPDVPSAQERASAGVAMAMGMIGMGGGKENYEPGIPETAGAPMVTNIAIKPGADLSAMNLGPRHDNIDNIILGAYQSVMGQGFQPTITSGRRSQSANAKAGSTKRSKHLIGQALDLRSNDSVMSAAQGEKVARNLKSSLGPGYGVLQHGSGMNRHIHMQYNGSAEAGDMDVPASFEAKQEPKELENVKFQKDTSDVDRMKNFTTFMINEFSNVMAQKIAGAMKGSQQQAKGAPQLNPF